MNKSLKMIGLGLVLAFASPVLFAAGAATVQLTGHVPKIVSQLPSKGHFVSTNLNLAIGLPLRNKEALTNLLQQISDPSSPNYHKYLTPAQFTEQFGPTAQDYEAVVAFAAQNGLRVTARHSNRMLLDVSGKSTDVEKAFGVNFKIYHHPNESRDFFAPDREPTIPDNLAILEVAGLSNYGRPVSHLKLKPPQAQANSGIQAAAKAIPSNGSGVDGNYIGDDFRNAYIPGSSLKGSGQQVALVQFDGFYASDIQEYETMANRTNIPLNTILIDGFNGQPFSFEGNGECSLDIEMVVSMAPALSQIDVYEGNPLNFLPNDVMNKIATDNIAHQVSSSWSWYGFPADVTDQILQEMALQGQTVFFASGDGDAIPVGEAVYIPIDSPYVTAVGGTTLTMTAGGGARLSETVWNWGIEFGYDGAGTSGGISTRYKIPYWQTNVNMTACQGSPTNRNFPDVAMTGDNVLVIAGGGDEEPGSGGTSCASPLWAAFTALINQQATNFNRAPIGFINPALYNLANSANYTNVLNDITTGNDTWSGSPNLFYAVTNYDICSGLGTPRGTNLINALVSNSVTIFQISAPPAPYGTAMSALSGSSPNGTWGLFVQDDVQFNTGMISNGWIITLTLGDPVGSEADMGLAMSASAASVYPGSNLVYYLTLTNYGGLSTATNVIVEDTLPTGVTLVSSNVSVGSIQRNGSLVTWSLGNLITNAGGALALTVTVPDTSGSIINSAVAQSSTPDPNPADNGASVTVDVEIPTVPQLSGSYNKSGNSFTLSVSGSTGLTIIQASTNLVNWVPLYTNSAAAFTFTDSTNYPYRFYRAVTVP